MGVIYSYRCDGCGTTFRAEAGFSRAMIGPVSVTVFCAEHGLGLTDTGVVIDRDGRGESGMAEVEKRGTFPCPRCSADSPVWLGTACPECGADSLEAEPAIFYD